MLRVNSGTCMKRFSKMVSRKTDVPGVTQATTIIGACILTDIRPAAGAPKGTSDLIGIRRDDGKFVAIECKTPRGHLREDQKLFIDAILKSNGIAGVARSAEDALKILEVNP